MTTTVGSRVNYPEQVDSEFVLLTFELEQKIRVDDTKLINEFTFGEAGLVGN